MTKQEIIELYKDCMNSFIYLSKDYNEQRNIGLFWSENNINIISYSSYNGWYLFPCSENEYMKMYALFHEVEDSDDHQTLTHDFTYLEDIFGENNASL